MQEQQQISAVMKDLTHIVILSNIEFLGHIQAFSMIYQEPYKTSVCKTSNICQSKSLFSQKDEMATC
jgi:hypothetical protein